MDKLPKMRKDGDLSEGGINIWINCQEYGYLDTSPREISMGHSSAVRLRVINVWINY